MFHAEEPDWEGLDRNRTSPTGRPAMLQTWRDLVFLHSRVPVEALQAMVPPGLSVEEFGGSAWLGFVPFRMSGIRLPYSPAAPWLSSFLETNIRTYVTHPIHGPGVWFFSLEASRYLGCLFARKFFKLPYFHASLSGMIDDTNWQYSGRRLPKQYLPKIGSEVAQLSDYLVSVNPTNDWLCAEPATFEYWLVERYRLYALAANNQLMTSMVAHEPYVIAGGTLDQIVINGLEPQFGNLDFQSVLVAKTLNVRCFSPERVS